MLSIIVPVRNESNIIHDVISYFNINSKITNYELIIINDFSDDDTLEKLNSIVSNHKNLKVFNNKKKRSWRSYKYWSPKCYWQIHCDNDG